MVTTNLLKLTKSLRDSDGRHPPDYSGTIDKISSIVLADPSTSNLQLLLHIKLFENELWKNFDPDCKVKHLELMILLCLYDLKDNGAELFHQMIAAADNNSDDFSKFIIRILNVTYDIRPQSNFRLNRLIVQLLHECLIFKSLDNSHTRLNTIFDILTGSITEESTVKSFGPVRLFSKWFQNLVMLSIEYLYSKLNDIEYIEYLKAVVLFLSQLRSQYPNCLNDYPLTGFNMQIDYGFRNFLKILIPKCDKDYFEVFKSQYGEKKDPPWNKITQIPTVYDLEEPDWFKFLNSLSMTELEDIQKSLSLQLIDNGNKEMVINSILYHVLNWKFHILLELEDWDEQTIFDRFDYDSDKIFQFHLPIEKSHKGEFDYELKHEIYNHLKSVLTRLKITVDKSNKLLINGKSKYFHKINSITTESASCNIEVNKNEDDFKNCLLILLEIRSPNKYSDIKRVKNFGLNLLAVREINSFTANNKVVNLRVSETETKFNYLIKLNSRFLPYYKHQNKFTSLAFKNNQQIDSLVMFKGIPHSFLSSGFLIDGNKKKSSHKESGSYGSVKLYSQDRLCDIIDYDLPANPLTETEAEAIYESLINKVSIVKLLPSGTTRILNILLSHIAYNFKDESVLIVAPNKNWVAQLESPSELQHKTGRLLNNINDMKDPIEIIEGLLSKTKHLARKLGLDEEFYSESVENAILFYKQEVFKAWNEFLKQINANIENIKNYPFEDFNETVTLEQVANSYFKIVEIGNDLISLAPILKFPDNELQIKYYLLMNYHKYIIISQDQILNNELPAITSKSFDNIILLDSGRIHEFSVNPLLSAPFKRLILLGDDSQMQRTSIYHVLANTEDIPQVKINHCYSIKDIFDIYGEQLPYVKHMEKQNTKDGDLYPVQIIPVENKGNSQVNILEAETCINIYEYMKSRSSDVCIVTNSLYQQALFKEMFKDEDLNVLEHVDDLTSHDYLVVSCFGYVGIKTLVECAKRSRRGIYYVGDVQEPVQISKGPLKVKRQGKYIKVHNLTTLG